MLAVGSQVGYSFGGDALKAKHQVLVFAECSGYRKKKFVRKVDKEIDHGHRSIARSA